LHSNSIYFGNFLKNYCLYGYEIFTVRRGHLAHQHVKILENLTKGFLGGRVGKNFLIPYISLKGGRGTPKFLHTLGSLRVLMTDT